MIRTVKIMVILGLLALCGTAWCVEPIPNLISHWKFDEGSGTTAYDSFGSNHGTIYGAEWTTGQINGALSFDGDGDYVNCGNDDSLNITDVITVAAWAKFSASQSNRPLISKWGENEAYILCITGNKIAFTIRVFNVNKAATSANDYNDGEWHHYVGVFNGSNVLLYVDGGNTETVIGDATTGPIDIPGGNPLRLGNYNSRTHNSFNGTIDEAMIFNKALSVEEVQQLYQDGLPEPPSIEAVVDLDPDVFEVKVEKPKEPKEPKEEFLEAFIELPADVNAADVDANTVTLSLNGTTLATAELPVIVDNVLDVLFPLDPNNVGTILGLEVTKVKVHRGKIEVKTTVAPSQPIDLIELTVSGDLIGGGRFSGTDAVRVMLKKHKKDHGD